MSLLLPSFSLSSSSHRTLVITRSHFTIFILRLIFAVRIITKYLIILRDLLLCILLHKQPYLAIIINIGNIDRSVVVQNKEHNFFRRVKKFTKINISSTIDEDTKLDTFNIVLKCIVELFLPTDGYQGVHHIVALE